MKCPFCSSDRDRVLESRAIDDGEAVRRRRECEECGERFTSYERIEQRSFYVIKKDGRREPYSRDKILKGIYRATEKRPISVRQIDTLLKQIEKELPISAEQEVEAATIGKLVMDALEKLDPVAYVRFASVYREFKSVQEFLKEINYSFSQKEGD